MSVVAGTRLSPREEGSLNGGGDNGPGMPVNEQMETKYGQKPDEVSFVYFIEHGPGGPIKIGRAAYPYWRLRHMQTSVPVELRLLGVIPFGDWTEATIQERFRGDILRGEWYVRTPELMAFIEAHAMPDQFGGSRGLGDLRRAGWIGVRQRNHLWRAGIQTVEQLRAALENGDVGKIRNFGDQTVQQIREALEKV